MVYTLQDSKGPVWQEFINAKNSGEVVEIDEEMYWYWLGVLPPVFMYAEVRYTPPKPGAEEVLRRVHFGFAEGMDRIVVFWSCKADSLMNGGPVRYFCQNSGVYNFSPMVKAMLVNDSDRQERNIYTGEPVGV